MSEICAQRTAEDLEKVLLEAQKLGKDSPVYTFLRKHLIPIYVDECGEGFVKPPDWLKEYYNLPTPNWWEPLKEEQNAQEDPPDHPK